MVPTLLDLIVGLSPIFVLVGLIWAVKAKPEIRYQFSNIGMHFIASIWVTNIVIYMKNLDVGVLPNLNEYMLILPPVCILVFVYWGQQIENWLKKDEFQ